MLFTVEQVVLAGAGLAFLSGIPGACLPRRSGAGQMLAAILLVAGCIVGLAGVGLSLAAGPSQLLTCPSPVPGADFRVRVDPLSALFLFPAFVVPLMGTIFGLEYWKQSEHPENGRRLRLFYGWLTASIAVVMIARDGVTFLFAWETMALSAFFLVATEDHVAEVREAGWLYLASSHFATLCLFGMFALIAATTGTFHFGPLDDISQTARVAIFILALVGFGTKAGLMPFHFWLPSAHAQAPSHVSAIMSGVLLKVGVYGFVRIMSLLIETPLWAGALVFFLGAVSALFALAFALAQHDFKRMLAYSSVENVGIIFLGIGLAMIGRSLDQIAWVALGLGGALYHVWNHAAFKSLLFLTSGSLIHATRTRETERLGGLAKSMPWTAVAFAIGAVSAAALPPFNGFASEFLLYLGLFRTLGIEGDTVAWPAASFVAPALAVIGALAAACFVGVFGVIFLGTPRTDSARHAHEAGPAILVPLMLLSALCLWLGMTPAVIEPVLDRALTAWSIDLPTPRLNSLAPLGVLTVANAVLIMLSLVVGFWLRWRLSVSKVEYNETWGCGYTGATARIQYTASSFTQSLVTLFSWVIYPRIYLPHVRGLFPRKAAYSSHAPDVILNDVVSPASQVLSRIFRISRWVQQGDIHAYLLYILAVVVVLLLWS